MYMDALISRLRLQTTGIASAYSPRLPLTVWWWRLQGEEGPVGPEYFEDQDRWKLSGSFLNAGEFLVFSFSPLFKV